MIEANGRILVVLEGRTRWVSASNLDSYLSQGYTVVQNPDERPVAALLRPAAAPAQPVEQTSQTDEEIE